MDRRSQLREAQRKRVIRNRLIAAGVLVVLIIVVIILLLSCNKKNADVVPEPTSEQQTEATTEETTTEAPPEIVNEKPISLYLGDYDNNTFYKATSLTKPWTDTQDLESFWAIKSQDDSIMYDGEIQLLRDTWYSAETVADYKIGYELSFDVNGEHKIITILQPGDIENNPDLYSGDYPEDGDYSNITGYMGAWLYDDIHHEEGDFYIHITQDEFTDESLLTSIKLRPTPQSYEISNLVLRGFSYSSPEEFDENGHYSGNHAASVSIYNE